MRAIKTLENEHRTIEAVLTCLERIADRGMVAGKLPRKAATEALSFLHEFADNCHNRKEEEQLYPLMETRGLSEETAHRLRMEHEQCRRFLRGMDQSLNLAADGNGAALQEFADNAWEYAQTLRAHMQEEDEGLFPMANMLLNPADEEQLETAFNKMEDEHVFPCTYEHCLRLAEELGRDWGVAIDEHIETFPAVGCFHSR